MQTAAKMLQLFRETKCKKNCVESSEKKASQNRGTSGPGESRILHVKFFELCDPWVIPKPELKGTSTSGPGESRILHVKFFELCDSLVIPKPKLTGTTCKPAFLLTVAPLIFVQLMTHVFSVRNVKIIEVVNNTIIMRNARNNMNKLTWSISLIINSDGHIKAHVLRLLTIQQPINAKHDRIEAIANMALEM